ncbi:unnamed protein product, partial [Amoebophrya sp. A25]
TSSSSSTLCCNPQGGHPSSAGAASSSSSKDAACALLNMISSAARSPRATSPPQTRTARSSYRDVVIGRRCNSNEDQIQCVVGSPGTMRPPFISPLVSAISPTASPASTTRDDHQFAGNKVLEEDSEVSKMGMPATVPPMNLSGDLTRGRSKSSDLEQDPLSASRCSEPLKDESASIGEIISEMIESLPSASSSTSSAVGTSGTGGGGNRDSVEFVMHGCPPDFESTSTVSGIGRSAASSASNVGAVESEIGAAASGEGRISGSNEEDAQRGVAPACPLKQLGYYSSCTNGEVLDHVNAAGQHDQHSVGGEQHLARPPLPAIPPNLLPASCNGNGGGAPGEQQVFSLYDSTCINSSTSTSSASTLHHLHHQSMYDVLANTCSSANGNYIPAASSVPAQPEPISTVTGVRSMYDTALNTTRSSMYDNHSIVPPIIPTVGAGNRHGGGPSLPLEHGDGLRLRMFPTKVRKVPSSWGWSRS